MTRCWTLLADLVPPEPADETAEALLPSSIEPWLLVSAVALVVILGVLLLRRSRQRS